MKKKAPAALQADNIKQAKSLLKNLSQLIRQLTNPVKRLSMALASSEEASSFEPSVHNQVRVRHKFFNLATDQPIALSFVRTNAERIATTIAAGKKPDLRTVKLVKDAPEPEPAPAPPSTPVTVRVPVEEEEIQDEEPEPEDEEQEQEQEEPEEEEPEEEETIVVDPDPDPVDEDQEEVLDEDDQDDSETYTESDIQKFLDELKRTRNELLKSTTTLEDNRSTLDQTLETEDDEVPEEPPPSRTPPVEEPGKRAARPPEKQKDGVPITGPAFQAPIDSGPSQEIQRPKGKPNLGGPRPTAVSQPPGSPRGLVKKPIVVEEEEISPSVNRGKLALDKVNIVRDSGKPDLKKSANPSQGNNRNKANQSRVGTRSDIAPSKITVDFSHALFKPEKEKQLLQSWTLLSELHEKLSVLQLTKSSWERQFSGDPEFGSLMNELQVMIDGLKTKINSAQKVLKDIDSKHIPVELRKVVDKIANNLHAVWSADNVDISYFYKVLDVPVGSPGEAQPRVGGQPDNRLDKDIMDFLRRTVYEPAARKLQIRRAEEEKKSGGPSPPPSRKEIFFICVITFNSVFSKTAELVDQYSVIVSVHVPSVPDDRTHAKRDVWLINTSFNVKTVNDLFGGQEFNGSPGDAWDKVLTLVEADLMPPPVRLSIQDNIIDDKGHEQRLSSALVSDLGYTTEKLKYASVEDNAIIVVPVEPLDREDTKRIHRLITSLSGVMNVARIDPKKGVMRTKLGKERIVGTWVDVTSFDPATRRSKVEVGVKVWLAPFKEGIWSPSQIEEVAVILKLSPEKVDNLRAFLL